MNGPTPPAQILTVVAADGSFNDLKPQLDGGSIGVPAPSWLTVTPALATTPAEFRVAVDQTGLAVGSYPARIQLTDRQGHSLGAPVKISLQVSTAPAQLDISPALVKFSGAITAGNLQEEILVRNLGGGAITPVSVTTVSGYPWLSGVVAPCTTVCAISVRAAIANLSPGPHNGLLRITTAIGSQDVPVSLFAGGHGPLLQLTAAGLQFYGVEDIGLMDSRAFSLRNIGDAAANWSAEVVEGQPWLSISPSSGATAAGNATALTATINAGVMGANTYSGLIRISAPGASFVSLDVPVVLRLDPVDTPAVPLLSEWGQVFQLQTGSEGIQQPLTLFATSPDLTNYQASPQSSSWLFASPVRGQASGSVPAALNLGAQSIAILPGFYSGLITFGLGSQGVRTLHAGFSVTSLTACTPENLYLTGTALPDSFVTRAGYPTPLEAVLVDNCGNFVSNGLVSAAFSNGDPGIPLEPIGGGHYAATWIPGHTSDSLPGGSVSVQMQAFAPPLAPAFTDAIGAVTSDVVPAIYSGGVLNNLNSQVGAPVAPGAVIQIYGSQFGSTAMPGTITNGQLSTMLDGVSVNIGGIAAPLYYSSSGQINAQVPAELQANQQYQVIVNVNGLYSNPEKINTVAAQPGLAVFPDNTLIAQDTGYNLITADHPAHAGEVIILYLTGMGATNPAVATGVPAPSAQLATTAVQPQVTVGGAPAQVIFAGLSPGSVGLYQIDVQIPSSAVSGNLPLVVSQGDVSSNTALVPVQ